MANPPRSELRHQRRAVVREWRAVPFRRRLEVVRSAKAGRRHSDEGAVQAAQRFAALVRRPGEPWYRGTPLQLICAWIILMCGVGLGAETFILLKFDAPTTAVLLLAAGAGLMLVFAGYWLDLLRESRLLLALPTDGTTDLRMDA